MECWNRMIFLLKRYWIRLIARFTSQKTGPRKLRQEVRTCEYEDVHVMWEMLRKTDREIARCPPLIRRRDLNGRRFAVLDLLPHNLCARS